MKNPSTRYLIGYLFRALLGTVLVLCIFSAVRILYFTPDQINATQTPWDKPLIFTDRLACILLDKVAAWKDTEETPASPTYAFPSPSSTDPEYTPQQPSMSVTPPQPSMPNMPSTPTMPSRLDMPVAQTTPNAQWGVTRSPKNPVYSMEGKRLGYAAPGSLLKVHRHQNGSGSDLVVCSIVLNGQTQPAAILRMSDTMIQQGALSATTERERELRIQQAKLLAQITERTNTLTQSDAGGSAKSEEYRKAVRDYNVYAKKANALRKAYDAASGPQRMEFADELRLLKHKENDIVGAYKAAKEKEARQPTALPASPSVNPNADPLIQRLRQDLTATEEALSSL